MAVSKQSRELNRTERAAAIQADQARGERNRKVAITAGIIAVLVLVVAGGFWATRGSSTAVAGTPKNLQVAVSGNTLVVGPASAPLKVTVYEDFQCPFCREFESGSRDFLHTDAAQGKVQVTYQPFNLLTADDYSARALSAWAAVLQKGTPKQALAMHDVLYENQPYENASSKPDAAKLRSFAKDAGVKDSSVLDAIGGTDDAVVTETNQAADTAKVTGTPTVFVNGQELQGSSVDDMVSTLEKQIAAA
jgi:protein-disulfide isomerase